MKFMKKTFNYPEFKMFHMSSHEGIDFYFTFIIIKNDKAEPPNKRWKLTAIDIDSNKTQKIHIEPEFDFEEGYLKHISAVEKEISFSRQADIHGGIAPTSSENSHEKGLKSIIKDEGAKYHQINEYVSASNDTVIISNRKKFCFDSRKGCFVSSKQMQDSCELNINDFPAVVSQPGFLLIAIQLITSIVREFENKRRKLIDCPQIELEDIDNNVDFNNLVSWFKAESEKLPDIKSLLDTSR